MIEQQQILTTQNLATLFSIEGLREPLQPHLQHMAEASFQWLTSELAAGRPDRHSQLIAIKNAAYAWRQMLFYLSHLPTSEMDSFIAWTESSLSTHRPEFVQRFRPALIGLSNVIEGESITRGSGQRLLGWTTSGHWLLEHSLGSSTPTV